MHMSALDMSELARMRKLVYRNSFTPAQLSFMRGVAADIPELSAFVDLAESGAAPSIGDQTDAYGAMMRYLEERGLTDTDDYRFLLFNYSRRFLVGLDYENLGLYERRLLDNIDRYVTDETTRGYWKYIVELSNIRPLIFSYEWEYKNKVKEADDYRLKNGIPESELGYSFAETLLTNMSSAIYYFEDLDKMYKKLLAIAAQQYQEIPEMTQELEMYYIQSQLSTNYTQFALLARFRQLMEGLVRPTDQALMRLSSAFYYFYAEKYDEGIAEMEKAWQAVDTVARSSKIPVEWMRANVAATRLVMLINAGRMDEYEAARDSIFNMYSDGGIQSRRAMLIILTELLGVQMRDLPYDNFITRYAESALSETMPRARMVALYNTADYNFHRGNVEQAHEYLDDMLEEIDDRDLPDEYRAYALALRGAMNVMSAKVKEGIANYAEAISYMDADSMKENIVDAYASMAQAAWGSADMEEAVRWAEEYWKVRPLSIWPEYFSFQDFALQRIRISALTDTRQKVRELEDLLKRVRSMGLGQLVGQLNWDLALVTASEYTTKNIQKAREYYEDALAAYLSYNTLEETLGFAPTFLNFLDATGDHKRHNEVVAALIYDYDHGQSGPLLNYINLLANEITNSVNNGNINTAFYYQAKIMDELLRLQSQVGADMTSLALAGGIAIPHIINIYAWAANTYRNTPDDQKDKFVQSFGYQPEQAETMLDFVQDIYRNYINDQDINYCNILFAKARWKLGNGLYDEAEAVLDSIVGRQAYSSYRGEARDFAPALRLDIARGREDYDEIERLMATPDIAALFAGGGGTVNINTLSNLCFTLSTGRCMQGRFPEAMETAKLRYEGVRRYINDQYAALTEADRTALASSGVAGANDINYILPYVNTPENRGLAYDAALYFRNILLESSNLQRNAIYNSGDSAVIALYERRLALAQEMAAQVFEVNESPEESERKRKVIEEAHQIESEIAFKCPAINDLSLSRDVSWRKVAKALGKQEAAIEFITYIDHESKLWRYGALLLRRGAKSPDFVPLLTQDELDNCIAPKRTATKPENGVNRVYSYPSNGKKLYAQLWEPLEPYLEGVGRVYYSPTGSLSTLAFAAIEDSARTSLCERYDLRLVSSTAQITRSARKRDKNRSFALSIVGDVDYDADAHVAASRRGAWAHLDNSIHEISYVDSLCRDLPRLQSAMLTGSAATEDTIRAMSGRSPELMLLSTHGFFLDAKVAARHTFYLNKGLTTDSVARESISPLKRGGIVLADGNAVWNNEDTRPDASDGIMTADEIAGLDLSGTQLLVLSACETGLGEPMGNEGVNGLQRGFKLSGVESMVMSLWVVNDTAGSQFMQQFYRRMLRDGEDRHEAFRKTQLDMRERYPRKPYYWAPFIMLD